MHLVEESLSQRPKRRRIKDHRNPKIVRDRSWKTRVLRGDEDVGLDLPRVSRMVRPGRKEDRTKLWTKIEQELRLEQAANTPEAELRRGLEEGVVTRIGTGLYYVDLGNTSYYCGVRGALSASDTGYTNLVAVGDQVLVSRGEAGHGVIERVLPRRTVLARPDVSNPDLSQVIVANVSQLLIVAAWEEPPLWLELIDRYLIAAAEGRLTPLICLNKIDLAEDPHECRETMALYQKLGHTVLFTSALSGEGIDELRQHLIGNQTAVAGVSGVGKSSLLMAVQPDLELRVSEVSEYSGEGRHATTQVSLLRLNESGYVVDTPGIRELGLITIHRHEVILYFPEIAALAEQCQFTDCTHTIEPGCAVMEAVDAERIPWSRYSSYLSIQESLPEYYTE
jgi:ribosome biogenesis GTPase